MSVTRPQVGETANSLLKKLVTATVDLGSDGGLFLTEAEANVLYFRLDGTNSAITNTSSTILSVRDGFSLTSAGSIGLTAGGSNKNITLTPSGTGWLNVGSVTGGSGVIAPLLQVAKEASGSSIFPSIELLGYQNGQTAQIFNVIAKAGGTAASPSNASANATLGGYRFYAYANSGWRNVGNISLGTNSGFGSADFSTNMSLGPSSSTGQTNLIRMDGAANTFFSGTTIGGASSQNLSSTLLIDWGGNNKTTNALGTQGVFLAVAGRTATDNVSSGTVATAVANSFAVPTFAASSATTFTNAANLYIAGDVAAGTNVTLTNSYGLWNAGKTRLDDLLAVRLNSLTSIAQGEIGTNPAGSTGVGIVLQFNESNAWSRSVRLMSDAGRINAQIDFVKTAASTTRDAYIDIVPYAANVAQTGALRVHGPNATVSTAFTTDATTAGAGAFTSAGGIYATKKIISGTTVLDGSTANATLTGGAGNMTITAGTGNSRTLTLQTTTSGGTANNAVVFGATQSATFNGPIIQKVSALTYASPTSVDVTLGNVYTVTTVNATGSVTFNATTGGTAGQELTILITNDATSAKTITFGTNFKSTGTLTASAAGRQTTITFKSDGTNFLETGRAILTT